MDHDQGGFDVSRGDRLINLLLSSDEDDGFTENQLLDAFFNGFPIENINRLLDSHQPLAIKAGAWLLSELGARSRPLLPQLSTLLANQDKRVRFYAIDAVLSSATTDDGPVIARAIRLVNDQEKAVRWMTLKFLSQASAGQLEAGLRALEGGEVKFLTEWLVEECQGTRPHSEVASRLADDDELVRKFAVAAAARPELNDSQILQRAAASPDVDISAFAQDRLKTRMP